jgi:diadenosine tetraphosphate (Ap4A) HIT family hydrolase
MGVKCPFCEPDDDRIWLDNGTGIALHDAFPVSEGHTLIIPRKHVASLFELSSDDQAALWQLVTEARLRLQERHRPDGFNVGVNDGRSAGQTVMHAHIHIIPRYSGDQDDPRGGIRWVIPEKARYWPEGDR